MGKRKEKTRPLKLNLKQILLGSSKEKIVPGSRFPNGTQSMVPVVDIQKGVVITEDGRYVKILEILPTNFYLKSPLEQLNIIHSLAASLKIAPSSLQILVCTQRADIDSYCEQMEQFYHTEQNEACKAMILEDAQLVNYLASNEAVSRHFYLVFTYTGTAFDLDDIAKNLADQAEIAYQYLDYCGLEVLRYEKYDEFLLKTMYMHLHKRADSVDGGAMLAQLDPVYGAPEIEKSELTEDAQYGITSVQDLLAPDECDLTHKDFLLIDGVYHTYFFVSGYPTEVGLAWLAPIVELGDGISVSYFLNKQRKEQVLPKVAKTTMLNRSRMRDVDDTRTDFEQLDDAISSGIYIKEKINREGEDFFYMCILIEITAESKELLDRRGQQVRDLCASIDFTVRRADWCHEQCFRSMLPLAKLDPDIEKKARRNILTTSAAAAFPFSSFELCDEKGVLLGINLHNNSAVFLDNYNADLYSNGNLCIFGMTGAGKTYTLLLLAMRLRMCGVQVFVIAPEKGFEYRDVCAALGGQYIKLARGSEDVINIMDIRRTTLDIDSEMIGHEQRNDSVLLDVIQDIRTYLKLWYSNMTPEEGYQLNVAVMECYELFGITKNNASLLNPNGSFKTMPDFSHLYPFLLKYPSLKNVAVVVKDLIDSGLGGQTNVNLNSSFIVLDTSSAREEDVSPITFLGTYFIRDELSRSRTRKKAVFGDELWKIAGSEGNEQAADFVIKLIKTNRGYSGVFIAATQNVIDYFALRDGKFGDTLLNNSRLKLLLQMEEAEALKLQEKLGLTDEEVMQIVRSGRGQGLLCAGKNRISVEIRASQAQHELITTSRTDLEKRAKKEE